MSDLPGYDAWKTREPEPDDTQEQCFCGRWYEPVDRNGEKADCCPTCEENAAEAAYDRAQEEPCFRGGEWAAAQREEALRIKRELK